MKFLKAAIVATAITGFAASAQAQDSGAYINVGVDTFEFDAYTISGKLGYNINEYFGVEGQAGFGIIDDKETIGGVETKAGVDFFAGAFGVVRFPVSESVDIFARGGYHFTEVSASTGNISASDSTDGLAVGGGLQFFWDELNGVRVEYTYLDVENGGNADTFGVSYVRNF